jgi:hypothetical protein
MRVATAGIRISLRVLLTRHRRLISTNYIAIGSRSALVNYRSSAGGTIFRQLDPFARRRKRTRDSGAGAAHHIVTELRAGLRNTRNP